MSDEPPLLSYKSYLVKIDKQFKQMQGNNRTTQPTSHRTAQTKHFFDFAAAVQTINKKIQIATLYIII